MRIGIEAGGTKIVLGLGTGPQDVERIVRVPTTTPEASLGEIVTYVRSVQDAGIEVTGVGMATFGPVALDPQAAEYGHLTTTPKPGWAGADLLEPIREVFDGPIGLDTDVNGAALGEHRWGAGRGLDSLVYVTIGTGVGGGVLIDGKPVHGLLHPEIGHLLVRHHPDDPFAGRCPTHTGCLEGLACGPAWLDRWGVLADDMDPEALERAVRIQAHYLGQMVMTLVLTVSPHRVILGGGVMAVPGLLEAVRAEAQSLLNGYVAAPEILERIDSYIVAPGLGDRAGLLGAIALAEWAEAG